MSRRSSSAELDEEVPPAQSGIDQDTPSAQQYKADEEVSPDTASSTRRQQYSKDERLRLTVALLEKQISQQEVFLGSLFQQFQQQNRLLKDAVEQLGKDSQAVERGDLGDITREEQSTKPEEGSVKSGVSIEDPKAESFNYISIDTDSYITHKSNPAPDRRKAYGRLFSLDRANVARRGETFMTDVAGWASVLRFDKIKIEIKARELILDMSIEDAWFDSENRAVVQSVWPILKTRNGSPRSSSSSDVDVYRELKMVSGTKWRHIDDKVHGSLVSGTGVAQTTR